MLLCRGKWLVVSDWRSTIRLLFFNTIRLGNCSKHTLMQCSMPVASSPFFSERLHRDSDFDFDFGLVFELDIDFFVVGFAFCCRVVIIVELWAVFDLQSDLHNLGS